MSDEQIYKIRYSIELWNKPPDQEFIQVRKNVRVTKTDYGYTDELFLASILKNEDGSVDSVLLLDSEDGPNITKSKLLLIRDAIDHHLKNHVKEDFQNLN